MPFFVISYDLRRDRNYESVIGQLKAWGAVRVLESFWLAELVGPATTVRDILKTRADSDDGLVVIQLAPNFDWATFKALEVGNTWLKAHSP